MWTYYNADKTLIVHKSLYRSFLQGGALLLLAWTVLIMSRALYVKPCDVCMFATGKKNICAVSPYMHEALQFSGPCKYLLFAAILTLFYTKPVSQSVCWSTLVQTAKLILLPILVFDLQDHAKSVIAQELLITGETVFLPESKISAKKMPLI